MKKNFSNKIIFLTALFCTQYIGARAEGSASTAPKQQCMTSGFGEKKCGYGCVKASGVIYCGTRPEENCVSAFGKVQCGYKCEAKYGDIVCDSFPSQKESKAPKKKNAKKSMDFTDCEVSQAPRGVCDKVISNFRGTPTHMGCTVSGNHAWLCKTDSGKPPHPIVVCSGWQSDSCAKFGDSW